MSKLIILHLSDIHFCDSNNYTDKNINYIINALHDNVVGISNLLVIISGDIASSGKQDQYVDFSNFLSDFQKMIKSREPQVINIKIVMVPGNHDVDYGEEDKLASKLPAIGSGGLYDDYIPDELEKIKNYIDFARQYNCNNDHSLVQVKYFKFDEYSFRVNLINSAAFSIKKGNSDREYHYLSEKDFCKLEENEDADYNFTVMHHPYYWYDWNCKNRLLEGLIRNSDIVFLGHEHYSASESISTDEYSALFQEGGKLSNDGSWDLSFFYISILDLETRIYTLKQYTWKKGNTYYESESKQPIAISKNRKGKNGLYVDETFRNEIDEDQNYLTGRRISEYYVFPLLEEQNDKVNVRCRRIETFEQFSEYVTQSGKLLVKGSREAGKSTLLKQLFLSLQSHTVPVLLFSTDFASISPKNVTSDKIERCIEIAINREYKCEKEFYEQFVQMGPEKKAILLDDFDYIDSQIQETLTSYLIDRFGVIILSIQRDLELKVVERARLERLLGQFDEFHICPFYKVKRDELIRNVISIRVTDSATSIAVVEAVSRLLSGNHQLYRWDPSFIIQLSIYAADNLHFLDAHEGNLFGTVFQFNIVSLLTPNLEEAGVEQNYALTIIDNIAFTAHQRKEYPISDSLMFEAIEQYKKKHKYICNTNKFIDCLLKSKIIREEGDRYTFCQGSYYAFFIAREIRRICQDENNWSYFLQSLEEAYLPLNSSIVLFVTYIMDSKLLIRKIKEAVQKTVLGWQEFDPKRPSQNFYQSLSALEETTDIDEEQHEIEVERNESTVDRELQLMWANPYQSGIADENEKRLSIALSLMIISSQLLPNLGHIIEAEDKDEFVSLVYQMPLQIFNQWSNDIEDNKFSIIRDLKKLHTLEYRNRRVDDSIKTDDDAINYLRRESISMLLELMDLSISNASRTSTYPLIDEFDRTGSFGYQIEWLISFERRNNYSTYFKELLKTFKDYKTGIPNDMVRRVALHYLQTNRFLSTRELQQINDSIFEGKLPSKILLLENKTRKRQQ